MSQTAVAEKPAKLLTAVPYRAIKALFGNDIPSANTLANYDYYLRSFGREWESAGPARKARYRYAESLHAAGLLERRITPITNSRGEQIGNTTEFRAAQP